MPVNTHSGNSWVNTQLDYNGFIPSGVQNLELCKSIASNITLKMSCQQSPVILLCLQWANQSKQHCIRWTASRRNMNYLSWRGKGGDLIQTEHWRTWGVLASYEQWPHLEQSNQMKGQPITSPALPLQPQSKCLMMALGFMTSQGLSRSKSWKGD